MPIFSAEFKLVLRHTVESAFFAVVLLGIAFGLTFFADYCRTLQRPPWFVFGVDSITAVSLIADATAWGLLLVKGIWLTYQRLFHRR
jgi:hypothetical protein